MIQLSECKAGSYCPQPGTQIPCPEGFFCPAGTVNGYFPLLNCTTAIALALGHDGPSGRYCIAGSKDPMQPCPRGKYCPNPGQALVCPRGHFCMGGEIGTVVPYKCWYTETWQSCPPGSNKPGVEFFSLFVLALTVIGIGAIWAIAWGLHWAWAAQELQTNALLQEQEILKEYADANSKLDSKKDMDDALHPDGGAPLGRDGSIVSVASAGSGNTDDTVRSSASREMSSAGISPLERARLQDEFQVR